MKKCTKCNEIKELTEFCFHKRNKDGLDSWCKQCKKNYYINNKDKVRKIQKAYDEKNKDYLDKKRRQYIESHKREKEEYDIIYRKENAEKIAKYKKDWEQKNKDSPKYKMRRNLRRRLHHAIQDNYKSDHTMSLLGCSIDEFLKHIESKWEPGMNWDNYGKYILGKPMKWHVDHIFPCDSFDLSDPEEQRKCFNYKNLRPLWGIDNLKKSKKLPVF